MVNSRRAKRKQDTEKGKAKYRELFDQSHEMKVVINRDGTILNANDLAGAPMGLKKEDMIGGTLWDHFDKEIADEMHKAIKSVFSKGKPSIKEYHLQGRGRDFWTHVIISPVKGTRGKISSVMISTIDITPLKKAERILKEQRDKLAKIQDNIDFGIMLIDRKKRIIEMNKTMREWSPKAKMGKSCYLIFDHCVHAQEAVHACPGEKVFKTGKPVFASLEFKSRDGRKKNLEFRCLPIFDASGQITNVMEIFDDVTEKYQSALKVEHVMKRAELYVDLMAHDIVNFITPLFGYVDFLMNDKNISEESRNLLHVIFDQVSKTSALIQNVRIIGEIERNGYLSEKQDLKDLLQRAERMATALYPWKKLLINIDAPHDKYDIIADRFLVNVFSNVIQNAIKADTHPEILIDISLSMETKNRKEYYLIKFDDRGPGIQDDQKEYLLSDQMTSFDSISIGPSTRTSRGMGLRIVKLIVGLSGGEIRMEDRVPGNHSKGASFKILLPKNS